MSMTQKTGSQIFIITKCNKNVLYIRELKHILIILELIDIYKLF